MKSSCYIFVVVLSVFTFATVATEAYAWNPSFLLADKGKHSNGHYSLDKAVSHLRKRHKGRVLSADTFHEHDRMEYRIRMLSPDGHIRVFRLDPNSSADID